MIGQKKPKLLDMVVVGFAIFSTFFGAGNMIFPPFLGNMAGVSWWIGFLCFILTDAGLAVMTVLAMARSGGTIWSVYERLGRTAMVVIVLTSMTIVGPLLCIPRTCATTFDLGIRPFFPACSPWLFGAAFFALVFVLTVRRSRVVDIMGKYMTPVLLLSLAVLIVKGMVTPLGQMASGMDMDAVAKEGFLTGYQTMDVLGALAFTLVVVSSVRQKGYEDGRNSFSVIAGASVVAVLGLFLVYGGLSYLGATTSTLSLGHLNQTGLLSAITQMLLGSGGMVLLAVIVLFACLTTAVGLASSSCDFFYGLAKEKIPYALVAAAVCGVSLVISIVGIDVMIAFATPVLNVLYPLLLTQIVLSFFDKRIKKDGVFRGAALGTLAVCLLSVAADYGAPTAFVNQLPLSSIGLYWILPAIAGGIIGAVVTKKRK